jgi:hypothetical protein
MMPKSFDWTPYAVNTVVTSVINSGIELGTSLKSEEAADRLAMSKH